MRLNNLSARLLVNEWLESQGHQSIGAEVSYIDFATRLRRIVAQTVVPAAFVRRDEACAYIRHIAHSVGRHMTA